MHNCQIEPNDIRFLLQARHEQHTLIRKYRYAVKDYLKTHLNLKIIHTSTKLFPDGYSKKIAPFPHCDLSADDVQKGIHFFIICIGDSQLGTHVYTDKKWASMVPEALGESAVIGNAYSELILSKTMPLYDQADQITQIPSNQLVQLDDAIDWSPEPTIDKKSRVILSFFAQMLTKK